MAKVICHILQERYFVKASLCFINPFLLIFDYCRHNFSSQALGILPSIPNGYSLDIMTKYVLDGNFI